jgi:hypothetical protein
MGMIERRQVRRYDLSLPVVVELPLDKESSSQNGQTRDISTQGLYFTLPKELPLGTQLDLTLMMPEQITHDGEVCVRLRGRVVRVDLEKGAALPEAVGVAAVIEHYDIMRRES